MEPTNIKKNALTLSMPRLFRMLFFLLSYLNFNINWHFRLITTVKLKTGIICNFHGRWIILNLKTDKGKSKGKVYPRTGQECSEIE
jgi:hypothetical protein